MDTLDSLHYFKVNELSEIQLKMRLLKNSSLTKNFIFIITKNYENLKSIS